MDKYDPIYRLQIGGALKYMDLMNELQDNLVGPQVPAYKFIDTS